MQKRLNAKEVFTPMSGDKFIFPIADGTVKLSGGDNPGSPRPRRRTRKSSRRIRRVFSSPLQDSSLYDGEARNNFWSMSGNCICRNHVEPRVKLYVSREASFPIPLKYIDVTRATSTTLDVMLEKNINDYWNVDGDRELSDTWTGFTRFTTLDEKPADGFSRSRRRLTRKQTTSRPDTLWPCSVEKKCKTKYVCIVEADESTRTRTEGSLHKDHEDHIAGKMNEFIESLQSCTQIYSHASSKENIRCESCSG